MKAERKKILKDAIAATRKDEDGRPTPEGVVEAARDPDNPLHAEFNWNDEEAAHQHRLAVARHLLREIDFVSVEKDVVIRTPFYTRDPRLPSNTQGYVEISQAKRNEHLARGIMLAELKRCRSFLERARRMADAVGIDCERDIDEMLDAVEQLSSRLSAPAPRRRRQPVPELRAAE